MLGSESGFDSLEECFEDLLPHIFALETGLSSDPRMNTRVSALDRFAMVSNSDAHSAQKLAREATCFNTELTYTAMYTALQDRDPQRFTGTLEFYPEEGKYHYDGHRKCQVRWTPAQTLQTHGRCPECGGKLTVGVLHRVERLADRSEETVDAGERPFAYIIPLPEVIGAAFGVGPDSKRVTAVYQKLLAQLGPELGILRTVAIEDIARCGEPLVAEAVQRMRTGAVTIQAGYDGEYGTIEIFSATERQQWHGQKALFTLGSPLPARVSPGPSRPAPEPVLPHAPQVLTPAVSLPLDAVQQQAVAATTGPIVVIAGPGSGKTRTLTHRLAHLVCQCAVPSTQILALTFTKRAAAAMAQRLQEMLPQDSLRTLRLGTFHRLARDLMQTYRATSPKTVLDAWEARQLLSAALHDLKLTRRPGAVQESLSLAKGAGLQPADMAEPDLQAVYTAYQAQLNAYGACDYDDLLLDCLTWLSTEPDAASQMQQRFPYILVDEFQDVNAVQYGLVKLLAGAGHGLFVIGDPDQAIYSFRGADPGYFARLRNDFPQAQLFQLATNYRSTETIVQAAAAVIAHNPDRQPLALRAAGAAGKPLRLSAAPSELAEGIAVVREISRMVGGADMVQADQHAERATHTRSFGDFAVLVRTGRQAEALEQCFLQEGLPYRLIGHKSFLEAQGVRQALAFARYVQQPDEPLRLFHVLDMAAFHPGKTTLAAVRQHMTTTGSLALAALTSAVPRATSKLQALAAAVEPYRALLSARPQQFLQRWHEEYGSADDADMQRLLHLSEKAASLAEFLDTIVLGQDADYEYTSTTGPMPVEAVTLMTLHAAKGLEFPVVFICGVEDGLLPMQASDVSVAEERRLFYVGLTRAREEVLLLRARTRLAHGKRLQPEPSPFLQELPATLVTAEEVAVPRQAKKSNQLSLFSL